MSTFLIVSALLVDTADADWRWNLEGGAGVSDGSATQRLRGSIFETDRPLTQSIHLEWIRDAGRGNSVELGYVGRFWFAPRYYAFGDARLKRDEPVLIDRQVRALAGVGARFQNRPEAAVQIEAGVGTVDTDFETDVADPGFEELVVLRGNGFTEIAEQFRIDGGAAIERGARLTSFDVQAGTALSLGETSVRYAVQAYRVDVDDTEGDWITRSWISAGYRF